MCARLCVCVQGNAEDVQEEFLEQVERLASSMSRNVKDEVVLMSEYSNLSVVFVCCNMVHISVYGH